MIDTQQLILQLSTFKKKVKLNQGAMLDQEFQQLKCDMSQVISEEEISEIEAAVFKMSNSHKLETLLFYPIFQRMYEADMRAMTNYFLNDYLDVKKSKEERDEVYKTWMSYSADYCKMIVGVIGVLGTLIVKTCDDLVTASRVAWMSHREHEAVRANPLKIKQHIKHVIGQNPVTQCSQAFFKVVKEMRVNELNVKQAENLSAAMPSC